MMSCLGLYYITTSCKTTGKSPLHNRRKLNGSAKSGKVGATLLHILPFVVFLTSATSLGIEVEFPKRIPTSCTVLGLQTLLL